MRTSRLGRREKIAVSLLASTLLALALGEVVVRVVAPQVGAYGPLFQPDPDLDYVLVPGYRDVKGVVQLNSHGLRDLERPVEKPPGVRRVLLLGDSFAFAAVPRDQSFAAMLDEDLGDRVEVINAGVPGWTTWQEAAWLRRDGLAYGPDAIVVALFVGNDVLEGLGGRLKVIDGELVERKPPRAPSWSSELYNRSHLYRLVKGVPEELWARLRGDSRRAQKYHRTERQRLAMCDPAAERALEPGWANVTDALREVRRLAGPSVPVVVLVIPDEYQVDPALRAAVQRRYGLDLSRYRWDLPQRRLEAICDELGLVRVCVLEDMQRLTRDGAALYLPLDSHWNERGNRVAADALRRNEAIAALSNTMNAHTDGSAETAPARPPSEIHVASW